MYELDEALERFQMCAPSYGAGFTNHGSMTADALVALGHPALLTGFVDVYAPRLRPLPVSLPPPLATGGEPVAAAISAEHAGDRERVADWIATYEVELENRSWTDVLNEAVEQRLDGAFAAAGHAWLRVAHATRMLGRQESAVRRRELAFALGYWAAAHQSLPGTPGAASVPGASPRDLLEALEPLPAARYADGLLLEATAPLEDAPGFRYCVESVALPEAEVGNFVSEICAFAAEQYLANPAAALEYIHALTIPSAVRLVIPHLEPGLLRLLAGRVFQITAALHAIAPLATADATTPTRGRSSRGPADERARLAANPLELRYRAACTIEEHAIQFADACLREFAACPRDVLLEAAADAVIRLDSGRY